MDFTHILLLLAASCSIASCQKLPASALATLMQEILSQASPDQALQLLKGATTKKVGIPELGVNRRSIVQERNLPRTVEVPLQVNRRPVIETAIPRTVVRNEVPKTVIMQKTNEIPRNIFKQEFPAPAKVVMQNPEMLLPKNVILQNGVPNKILVQNGKDTVTSKIIVKKPELTNKVVLNPEIGNRKILVQKGQEVPLLRNLMIAANGALPNKGFAGKTVIVQKNNMSPQLRGVSEVTIVPELVVKQEKIVAMNPFLPAASPISGLPATMASPSAIPQSRGQYLRKIPIPPPTI